MFQGKGLYSADCGHLLPFPLSPEVAPNQCGGSTRTSGWRAQHPICWACRAHRATNRRLCCSLSARVQRPPGGILVPVGILPTALGTPAPSSMRLHLSRGAGAWVSAWPPWSRRESVACLPPPQDRGTLAHIAAPRKRGHPRRRGAWPGAAGKRKVH